MRKPIIAGNWKMNKTHTEAAEFVEAVKTQIPSSDIEEIKTTNLDAYLKRKGITSIEKLLGPDYSRTQSITVATELALSSENIKNFI